ncbi:ribonuclease H-like protein, partial [Lentinus tigrinus ALCF2SS1-6]
YSYKQYPPTPEAVYTRHEDEANDPVGRLKGPLGFDLEWPVVFRHGRKPVGRRTALVQICDSRMIPLVQASIMSKFPQKVKEVIENKDVIKLDDGQKLFRDFGLLPAGLVELGALARQAYPTFSQSFNRSIVALSKVVERYTHKTLDVRTSDWEAKLSQPQITYAANDAHCAGCVYQKTAATVAATATATFPVVATGGGAATDDGATAQAGSSALPATASTSSTTGSSAPRINSFARPLAYASQFEPPSTTVTSQGSAGRPGSASTTLSTTQTQNGPPRPQHIRAYKMWHQSKMPLRDICAALRSKENPLAESTVISYVVRALQAGLPYDLEQLKGFVQLERGSWVWHRDWILEQDGYKK